MKQWAQDQLKYGDSALTTEEGRHCSIPYMIDGDLTRRIWFPLDFYGLTLESLFYDEET